MSEVQAAVRAHALACLDATPSDAGGHPRVRDGHLRTISPTSTASLDVPPKHVLARRVPVAHRGFAWLRLGTSGGGGGHDGQLDTEKGGERGEAAGPTPGGARMDPVEVFASLVGKPRWTTTLGRAGGADVAADMADDVAADVAAPAVLRACDALYPISRTCDATEESIAAAVAAEAAAVMAAPRGRALADPTTRVAITVHARGDDSHAVREAARHAAGSLLTHRRIESNRIESRRAFHR